MKISPRIQLGRLMLLVVAGVGLVAPRPLHAEKPDVHVALVPPQSPAAGGRATVIVEMVLGAGWHVNSHSPAEKFLIPTVVSLTTTSGTLSEIRYPPDVEKRFAFADKPMVVYEGTVRFEADLSLPADASGTATIAGNVSFQACNDRQCFAPTKLPVEATIVIVPARASVR